MSEDRKIAIRLVGYFCCAIIAAFILHECFIPTATAMENCKNLCFSKGYYEYKLLEVNDENRCFCDMSLVDPNDFK